MLIDTSELRLFCPSCGLPVDCVPRKLAAHKDIFRIICPECEDSVGTIRKQGKPIIPTFSAYSIKQMLYYKLGTYISCGVHNSGRAALSELLDAMDNDSVLELMQTYTESEAT